jgi:hypothetical protein
MSEGEVTFESSDDFVTGRDWVKVTFWVWVEGDGIREEGLCLPNSVRLLVETGDSDTVAPSRNALLESPEGGESPSTTRDYNSQSVDLRGGDVTTSSAPCCRSVVEIDFCHQAQPSNQKETVR